MNINVLNNISYGVYVATVNDSKNQRPTGCIVNSVMQVTANPATVALSVNTANYTNGLIKFEGLFAISILPESVDPKIIGNFGFRSGRDFDKFKDVPYHLEMGVAVPDAACGFIVLSLIDALEAGSHTVFLGKVEDGDVMCDLPVMTYSYYHNVIKGKSPKNAPTYRPPV